MKRAWIVKEWYPYEDEEEDYEPTYRVEFREPEYGDYREIVWDYIEESKF